MKRQMWWMVVVLATAVLLPLMGQAQDAQAEKTAKPQPQFEFYRVNFTLKELEDGKLVNSRNYVTNMRTLVARSGSINLSDASASVRTGIKVPVATRSSDQNTPTVNYMDVGVNIDCRLESPNMEAPATALRVSMDISSLAPARSEQTEVAAGNPIIRSVRGSATIPFILDKPILVTSVDDVTSKRQYQLEVKITKQ